jgi:hypothetical protein
VRLRGGEFLIGAASAALVLSLFLNWFETDDVKTSGWSGLALWVVVLVVLTLLACVVLIGLVQTGAPIAPTMLLTVINAPLTIFTFIVVTVDVLTKQSDTVDLLWPAIAGIAFSAMVAVGAWRSMGDERLDAPESAVTPPEARVIPKG